MCAIVGAVSAGVGVVAYRRAARSPATGASGSAAVLAATVGAAILLWRAAANTAALNDDPIPWVSPNDVLSPVIVYVALGLVGGSTRLDRAPEWAGLRALLTLIALVVNVVTI